MDKDKIKQFFIKEDGKFKKEVLTMFLLGIVLMIFSNMQSLDKKIEPQEILKEEIKNTDFIFEIEEKLESLLKNVEGCGNVDVMITTSENDEIVLAKDVKYETNKTTENGSSSETRIIDSLTNETTIVFYENSSGNKEPVIIKNISPKISGAVVVAEGGDNVQIKKLLTEAISALLDLPTHKIQILKMKN